MKPVAWRLLAVIVLLPASPTFARVVFEAAPGADSVRAIRGADSLQTKRGVDSMRVSGRPDSVRVTRGADSTRPGADSIHHAYRPRKSPGLAMLCSAIVPGAGQFYNQSYWKVPVVLGLGLYFASTWLDQNRRTEIYREKYAAGLASNDPSSDLYLRERDFYKEQRDTFAWYFVILYFVNIADAYVDASLFDFDVGGDLSLRVLPGSGTPLGPVPGVTLRLSF
jgi:hypothetical protein